MTQNLAQNKSTFRGVGNTNVPHYPPQKTRNWFFTLNNYTKKDIGTIFDEKLKLNLKQFCFQEEIGKNGTPHLQGVLAYSNAISFSSRKKLLPRANWSPCKNLKRALAYCCKEDTRNGKTWTYNYEIPMTDKEFEEWQKKDVERMAEEFVKEYPHLDLNV